MIGIILAPGAVDRYLEHEAVNAMFGIGALLFFLAIIVMVYLISFFRNSVYDKWFLPYIKEKLVVDNKITDKGLYYVFIQGERIEVREFIYNRTPIGSFVDCEFQRSRVSGEIVNLSILE